MSAPEPDDLRALGKKIDEARGGGPKQDVGPGAAGIAFRFATELGAALFVGAGLGWLLDRWLHTAPIFIVVMFALGAAAGIRNVMRAAAELNAEAAKHPAPRLKDEE
jgi:ATP synthase protein I